MRRVGCETLGGDDVGGEGDDVAEPGEEVLAGVDHIVLQQGRTDTVALGREEREAHAAADDERVDLGCEGLDDTELVGDLRAAEHDGVGVLGVAGERLQHVHLGLDELARVGREQRGDVEH